VNRAVARLRGQRRTPDESRDLLQAVVRMVRRRLAFIVMMVMVMVVPVCVRARGRLVGVRAEPRGRDAGAQDPFGRHATVVNREAAERGLQRLHREPEIEQAPEHHVARHP
jgi:hypothetical protein